MNKVTNVHRDYLAEIYQASHIESNQATQLISSADLADRLFTSQSTVNRMIERLRTIQLVKHHRYVGVQLTELGKEEALRTLRKQAIIESFLVNVMDFEWDEVYLEARQIRHKISDLVLDRMWQQAGYPEYSPFGEWIGTTENPIEQETILVEAEIHHQYKIARVLTRQSDRLHYMGALGLKPGITLNLLHKSPFNGPIQIQLEREYRILGHELASMMTVVPE